MASCGAPARIASVARLLRRVPRSMWVLLLGAAVLLPRISQMGFWEPGEADIARAAAAAGSVDSASLPLNLWLIRAGFAALGVNELAGRLPLALCGLLCLLLVQRIGSKLAHPAVGLIAPFVLATTPAFLFQCRQLVGDLPLQTALLAAAGGGACYLWAPGLARGRPADLIIALLGAAVLAAWVLCAGARAMLRPVAPPPFGFVEPLRAIGSGMFPWTGLLVLALPPLLAGSSGSERTARLAPISLGVALAGYLIASLTRLRYPAFSWLALALGLALHEIWQQREVARPVLGLCAAALVVALQIDLAGEPAALAFVHLPTAPAFPPEVSVRTQVHLAGATIAALAYVALAGPPLPVQHVPSIRLVAPLLRAAARAQRAVAALLGWLVGGRRGWLLGAATVLTFCAWCIHGLLPDLDHHLSAKAVLARLAQCRRPGDALYHYGAPIPGSGAIEALTQEAELLQALGRPRRALVLLPTTQLGDTVHAARARALPLHVLYERSSRHLLVTNRLVAPCDEDLNPLRRMIRSARPHPGQVLQAEFEGRVRLLGYDLPTSVVRGGRLRLVLYFQVLAPVPPGYKLFVHLDGAADRIHGDHEPLGGRYPTQLWLAGDYLVDEHEIDLPLLTTAGGRHEVLAGFWLGQSRLRVTRGPQDGQDRVQLASVHIR